MDSVPTEASPSDGEKWDIFDRYITKASFDRERPAGAAADVFAVRDDLLGALFSGAYQSLRVNGDPSRNRYDAISFLTDDGVHQVRVMSRVSPGDFYEFEWTFEPECRREDHGIPRGDLIGRKVQVCRRQRAGSLTNHTANVLCMVQNRPPVQPQDMKIRVFCAAIDETIDLNLGDLGLHYHESAALAAAARQAEQTLFEQEMAPWRHVLLWMGRLRTVDPIAFARLPGPLRAQLQANDLEARLRSLTPQHLMPFQMQGMLPHKLPRMIDAHIADLMLSIQIQQNLRKQAFVTVQYQNAPWPIPPLVEAVVPSALSPYDLQAMMTIGGLREMWRLWDEKAEELGERDVRVKVLLKGGIMSELLGRPEFAPLLSDPQILKEVQDERDVQRRRSGNFDMSLSEVSTMIAYQQEMAMIPVGVGMAGGGMFGGMMGMLGLESIKKKYACAPPAAGSPPWKVYQPYMC